ncbi:transposase [Streptomyces sp. S1D4-23]|nr:transposase [Streptomyces sp. RLB3-6]QDO05508.1 transposase [Streptomyces sp. S1D4-23]
MWEVIRPLLAVRNLRKGGGVRKYGDRLVLDSIFCVLRSGCQWRMLPRDLMPWDAAHRWFTKWRRDGSWDRIHDELRRQLRIGAGRDPVPSAAVIDAQSIKTSEGGPPRPADPQGWSYQENAAIRQPSGVRTNWMVLVPPPSNGSPSRMPAFRYSPKRDAMSPAISVRSEVSHSENSTNRPSASRRSRGSMNSSTV